MNTPSDRCPDQDQLREYSQCLLSEKRSEQIARHLETCTACEQTVQRLEMSESPLLAVLRTPAAENPYSNEPELRELRPVLQALVVDPSPSELQPPELSDRADSDREVRGNYRLLEKLGEGGMGAVYKALHTKLQKTVALKVLPEQLTNTPGAIERFQREMEAAGKLDHPNIVRALDAGEANGRYFLVMEQVDGIDLSTLVKRIGPLPVASACEIIRQAAMGVQHAYSAGLVHRDIKPSNLMLSSKGQVKILDFGLALLHDHQAATAMALPSTGQVMGTLDYMAPEQASDSHDVEIRADIYSLGATLYKLLTGKAPYEGVGQDSPLKKLWALANKLIPPVQSLAGNQISDELAGVVHRALSKLPDRRYFRPYHLAEALNPYCIRAGLVSLVREAHRLEQSDAESLEQPASTIDEGKPNLEDTKISVQPGETLPKRRRRRTLADMSEDEQPKWRSGRFGNLAGTVVDHMIANPAITKILSAVVLIVLFGYVITILTSEGEVILTINQRDVKVTIDGGDQPEILIQAPDQEVLVALAPGSYEMEVSKQGFTTWTRSFRIEWSEKKFLEAKLIPMKPSPRKESATAQPDTQREQTKVSRSLLGRSGARRASTDTDAARTGRGGSRSPFGQSEGRRASTDTDAARTGRGGSRRRAGARPANGFRGRGTMSPHSPLREPLDIQPGDFFVSHFRRGALFHVDPKTGKVSTLSMSGSLKTPRQMALEPSGDILIADRDASPSSEFGSKGAVIRIDAKTGAQTVVAASRRFVDPVGILLEKGGTLLVSDANAMGGNGAIIRLNIETGQQEVVSERGHFTSPHGIALENASLLLVCDARSQKTGALIRVDLKSGEQTIVSSGQHFTRPVDVAVEADGQIIVVDPDAFGGNGGILRIDPATGKQSVVSQDGFFNNLTSVVVQHDGMIVVVDADGGYGSGGVISVNPKTGRQKVIAQGSPFHDPYGLAIIPKPTASDQTGND